MNQMKESIRQAGIAIDGTREHLKRDVKIFI